MSNKLARFLSTIVLLVMLTGVSYFPAAASTFPVSAFSGVSQSFSLTQKLVSLTSPIHRGASATIVVRTQVGARCVITVYYKSGPSKAKGLGPKIAGPDGRCSWTWMVGTNTTLGTWSIVVKTGLVSKMYPFVVN